MDVADLLVANGRVLTIAPRQPEAEAVAVRAGRILAVGTLADLRALVGPDTATVDAEGGWVVPAFHDAHLHLLSYARVEAGLDCSAVGSLAELRRLLAARAAGLPRGHWLRASGYDESRFAERRHPDRHDLDAAVPHHPVRLRHRTQHLDVLNTAALRLVGLEGFIGDRASAARHHWPLAGRSPLDCCGPVAREGSRARSTFHGPPSSGQLYDAGELLRSRMPRPTEAELGCAVRRACQRLLARGVTTVQDASVTNGAERWELFHRLAAGGGLPLRLFVMPGAAHWRELAGARQPTAGIRLGPVKLVLNEAVSDPAEAEAAVAAARAAGYAVALHATSEAELAIALHALRGAGPRDPAAPPDRVEHGAVIPDAFLEDLRATGVTVVGQPALVYLRGDVYRAEFQPEQHAWLYRSGSLVRLGIPYAASSDAPLTEPLPALALMAASFRRTLSGTVLGPEERLSPRAALAAHTLQPARAVGAAGELGRLRPGALADLAVLDPDVLVGFAPEAAERPVRLTIMDGRVVWRRPLTPARATG